MRERARELRRAMTIHEVKLWVRLKAINRRGFHIRRQAPADGYILDFVEFSRKIIIEVDGPHHEGSESDKRRDAHFQRSGFTVLRFWNHEVDNDLDGVVERIVAALKASPHPSR
jgi:very-short-patch-repair endonuclease